jgi:hypothetical protein
MYTRILLARVLNSVLFYVRTIIFNELLRASMRLVESESSVHFSHGKRTCDFRAQK